VSPPFPAFFDAVSLRYSCRLYLLVLLLPLSAHRQFLIGQPEENPIVDILVHGPLGKCDREGQVVLLDFVQSKPPAKPEA